MKVIPLTRGRVARVSDEDYDRVSQFKWTLHSKGKRHDEDSFYARRNIWVYGSPSPRTNRFYTVKKNGKEYKINGHYENQSLHSFIMDPPKGLVVDHIDGNGLNNTRENLRIVTRSQNCMNSKVRGKSNSGFRGVTWDSQTKKWRVTITHDHKTKSLGRYSELADAINARLLAEKELFGDFSSLSRANKQVV